MGDTPKYLGHVNIDMRNAERAQQWYEDVLGLHPYDCIPGRAAFMSANREASPEMALMEVGEDAPGLQKRHALIGFQGLMLQPCPRIVAHF